MSIGRWFIFGFFFIPFLLLGQKSQQENFNLRLVSQANDYAQDLYSDVWGYTDTLGVEYGIIGTRKGTAIYNLQDPANPSLTQYIEGASSIWRDIKTFNNYIYVIADQGTDGLLVIDMALAPQTVDWTFYKPTIFLNGEFRQLTDCHNVYIDENGFLYLSGCSISNGVLIFDLNQNPEEPKYVGRTPTNYSHDVFVRGDTLWTSDFNDGVFSVVDVTNKSEPVLLADQSTGFRSTHNAWISDDGNFIFTTDERPNAFVEAYDVSDLDNIQLVDRYRPTATLGRGVYPHNTHYHNGFLVTSFYTDGLKVVDATRPSNLVEVGSYDTFFGGDGGTNGNWGAYPYLPSGLILASDIGTGLYVIEPSYTRASYLEGSVRSARDNSLLPGAEITILNSQANQSESDDAGSFKTGIFGNGIYQVEIKKLGYITDTIEVSLTSGEVTEIEVLLQAQSVYNLSLEAQDLFADQAPIPQASFYLENEVLSYQLRADESGIATSSDILSGSYQLYAGAWGYKEVELGTITINEDRNIIVSLEQGYQDFFNLDLGWQSSGDAISGLWTRGIPIGTDFGTGFINPGFDYSGDFGNQCFMTGNGGSSAGFDDVDDGTVILESPPIDLSGFKDPRLSLAVWFVNTGGGSPLDDNLTVSISNGQEEFTLFTISESQSEWKYMDSLELSGTVDLSSPVVIRITTSDLPPNGHLVEAAIDAFSIIDAGVTTSLEDPVTRLQASLTAWPNPTKSSFQVQIDAPNSSNKLDIQIFNAQGQLLQQSTINGINHSFAFGDNFEPGVYILVLRDSRTRASQWLRLIKQ